MGEGGGQAGAGAGARTRGGKKKKGEDGPPPPPQVARVDATHECVNRGPGETWETDGYKHALDPDGWWWRKKGEEDAVRVEHVDFKDKPGRTA